MLFNNVAWLETKISCFSLIRTKGASRKAGNTPGTVAPCNLSQCPEAGLKGAEYRVSVEQRCGAQECPSAWKNACE